MKNRTMQKLWALACCGHEWYGNNMNYVDAVRLAKAVKAQICAPMHWGMFEPFSADPVKFKEEACKQGVSVWMPGPYEVVKIN